jgi:phosphomethylpyrimidine synthase
MFSKTRNTATFHKGTRQQEVGANCRTFVMALVGASSVKDLYLQFKKIEAIGQLDSSNRPEILADLSIVNNSDPLYKFILAHHTDFLVSTLPIYTCQSRKGSIDSSELLERAIEQLEAGVNMLTIHPTPNQDLILSAKNRLTPWTSRGGGIVIADLITRDFQKDNVYMQIIDELIQHCKKHKAIISIGASFRSANIFDSNDKTQNIEFDKQEELAKYIKAQGVDVIVEGPGHSSPKDIKVIAERLKRMSFPIMPLGPIPTDIAIDQDHIASSIGAALLGVEGAVDLIAAVTREEHTGGIPRIESTIEAIKAAKITAHVIDIYKLGLTVNDYEYAKFRADNNTCVYNKGSAGCSRCLNTCPLLPIVA